MADSWRITRLGVPCLVHTDRREMNMALARKDAALLAYVGMNGRVGSAHVAALLWPQATESGALNNLRQRLHRLRKATSARLLEVADNAELADDLCLEPMPDRAALEASPDAWDGELLQGVELDDAAEFSAWLAAERGAWVERRRDALAAIASSCQQTGELVRGLAYARHLLAGDPLSEQSHRRVMRLHYLRGDSASAVAAFEACERALKDELGLRPSAETLDLLGTIERGAAATAVALPVPASLLRPPRAVGRDSERAQLLQAHADGCIAALVGEAGMGKTRLLQDFVAAQPSAVYVQARPGDAAVPYGALARLLRMLWSDAAGGLDAPVRAELGRIAPELRDYSHSASAGQSARLQRAIEQALNSVPDRERLTLVVDDLHFADPASVEMLRALVDSDALPGLRWVFAHRPIHASDDNGALLQSLADAPRARWIVLAPLTEADLTELLGSLALPGIEPAALSSALARHTGGNPLYVLETLREARAMHAGVRSPTGVVLPRPQNIAHMIDRRLQRLSERALALARVAALAGPDFTTELAEQALATPAMLLAGAWVELEAADVLRGNAFAHDLVRDGMLRATPQPIAVHAHRLIARFLQDRAVAPARLAHHWEAAAEHARAGEAYRRASALAHDAGRPREEAALLLDAARCFDASGDIEAALSARAHAVPPTVRGEGPLRALEISEPLLQATAGTRCAGMAWAFHAVALIWAGRIAEAEAAGRSALSLLPSDQAALRMDATRTVAMACGQRGSPAEGMDLLRPWLANLDKVGDLAQRIYFCGAYTNLLLQGDRPAEALDVAAKHQALARQAGDTPEELTALINTTSACIRRGDLQRAIEAAATASSLGPVDDPSRMLVHLNDAVRGYALSAAGRYREAVALLDTARRCASEISAGSVFQAMAEDLLASVWIQLGQAARARRLVAADPEGLPAHRRANRLVVRAMCAPSAAQAETLLRAASETAGEGQGVAVRMTAQLLLARRGEPESAIEPCSMLAELARAREHLPLAAMASAYALDAKVALQPGSVGISEVERAEQAARSHRAPQPYLPELLLICARAYRACGREEDAARCLLDAQRWVHETALPQVPPEYRDGFLQRNPVNLAIQAEAARADAARA